MEIFLDGTPQMTLQAQVPNVGAALVELNAWLQGNGRALQGISIDGQAIPADQLTQEIGAIPVDKVKRLDVTSARVVDLVLEALDEVGEVLPEMPVACQTLSQILSGETPDEGLDSLDQVIGIWNALRERRRQIADALGRSLDSIQLSSRSVAAREQELVETLARVGEARAKEDFAALSDLLAYDLSALAEQEQEVLAAMRAFCAELT